jgi:hypothetical protein
MLSLASVAKGRKNAAARSSGSGTEMSFDPSGSSSLVGESSGALLSWPRAEPAAHLNQQIVQGHGRRGISDLSSDPPVVSEQLSWLPFSLLSSQHPKRVLRGKEVPPQHSVN